jgi:hypothetical protein
MFIKLDKTNLILLGAAGLLVAASLFVPALGSLPLALVVIVIAYLRSVSIRSGKPAVLFMALMFLLVPLVLYILFRVVNSGTPAASLVLKLLPLIVFGFVALMLAGWLYGMKTIRAVPFKDREKTGPRFILRDAQTHFGFLLEKGYQISQLDYVDHPKGGWHLQLDSPGGSLSVVLDEQLKPLLAVGKVQADGRPQILLDAMIYHLTGRDVSKDHPYPRFTTTRSQSFARTALLLKLYLDPIENYLRDHPGITENELKDMQARYFERLDQPAGQRRKN